MPVSLLSTSLSTFPRECLCNQNEVATFRARSQTTPRPLDFLSSPSASAAPCPSIRRGRIPLRNHFLLAQFCIHRKYLTIKRICKANFYDKCYQTNVACVALAAPARGKMRFSPIPLLYLSLRIYISTPSCNVFAIIQFFLNHKNRRVSLPYKLRELASRLQFIACCLNCYIFIA